MITRAIRLDRARKVFASLVRLHEIELAGLKRRGGEIETALREMNQALTSPLLGSLPVFSAGARRMVELKKQLTEIDRCGSAEREAIIAVKTREKLSGSMSATLKEVQARAETENDIQELISLGTPASLPQGDAD